MILMSRLEAGFYLKICIAWALFLRKHYDVFAEHHVKIIELLKQANL